MLSIFNSLKILKDVFIPVTPGSGDAGSLDGDTNVSSFNDMFNELLIKYRELVVGIFGLLTLSLIILLIYLFINLANNSHSPNERKTAIARIIGCCVVIAIFGSITLIFGLFWNSFK